MSAYGAVDSVDAAAAEILLGPEDIVGMKAVGLGNGVRMEMHGMGSMVFWM